MEKFTINHSLKDIPIPPKRHYLKLLMAKIDDMIARMRWKTYFFLKQSNKENQIQNYGFKTQKTPPSNTILDSFEWEFTNSISDIEFRKYTDTFQKKLCKEVSDIRKSKHLLVKADKTKNIYKMKIEDYNKLLESNITKNYRKVKDKDLKLDIDRETKKITDKLKISDRVAQIKPSDSYLLLKDHKDEFSNCPKARLINPTKMELGKISKVILERITKEIRTCYKLNQWSSTQEATEWFHSLEGKRNSTFLQFDIVEFYPSISSNTLNEALVMARTCCDVSDTDIHIIMECRRSILISNESQWTKTDNPNFDVAMGGYDSAVLSDLISLYILYRLTTNFIDSNDIGIYRDDGLLRLKNCTNFKHEKIRKKLSKIIKELGFGVELSGNVKIVNFLDVTLNLDQGTIEPFIKQNGEPIYVNAKSNHPVSIIKQIPRSINSRLNRNSSNIDIFNKYKPIYEKALNNSGYRNTKLEYVDKNRKNSDDDNSNNNNNNNSNSNNDDNNNKDKNESCKNNNNIKKTYRRKRNRRILWFTPPFNKQVKTNIGGIFINLIKKHFPPSHKLHKIFNRNTLKVGYACTDNMDRIIKNHNKKVTQKTRNTEKNFRSCDCRKAESCVVKNKCLTEEVIYQAQIYTRPDLKDSKYYVGLAGTSFKVRWRNHDSSFKDIEKRNNTALSNHYWKLIEESKKPKIKWKIIRKSKACTSLYGNCHLCADEKLEILKSIERDKLLNSRMDIITNCIHKKSFSLNNIKT